MSIYSGSKPVMPERSYQPLRELPDGSYVNLGDVRAIIVYRDPYEEGQESEPYKLKDDDDQIHELRIHLEGGLVLYVEQGPEDVIRRLAREVAQEVNVFRAARS